MSETSPCLSQCRGDSDWVNTADNTDTVTPVYYHEINISKW